jgi:hypothetical protein
MLARVVSFVESESPTRRTATEIGNDTAYRPRVLIDLFSRVESSGTDHLLVHGEARQKVWKWTSADIDAWRTEVRAFLRNCVEHNRINKDGGSVEVLTIDLPSIRIRPVFADNYSTLLVDGSARDALWFQLLMLCRKVGILALRRCSCDRVFVKTGRREFCSNRCQKREYMRQYRATPRRKNHGKTSRAR